MKYIEASRVIMVVGMSLASSLACSDPERDGTGGIAGTGAAGGSAMGGTAGAAGTAGGAGGTDAGSTDAGPTKEEACADWARAACEKHRDCLPWYIPANFGDTDTCVAQYAKTLCLPRVSIEDSTDTPAAREACAVARRAATCAQWFDNDLAVSPCLLLEGGPRATGSVCGTAQQCQTTKCDLASGDCGRCGGPLVGAGEPCISSNDCGSNLQCFDGVCGRPRGLGEPCSTAGACRYEFECIDGRCGVAARAGEACDTIPCRRRDGLSCLNNVCEPWIVVGPGESCDLVERFCSRGGFCKRRTPTSFDGICVAGSVEGEPCDNNTGPYCVPFASCVGGVCTVSNPALCK